MESCMGQIGHLFLEGIPVMYLEAVNEVENTGGSLSCASATALLHPLNLRPSGAATLIQSRRVTRSPRS